MAASGEHRPADRGPAGRLPAAAARGSRPSRRLVAGTIVAVLAFAAAGYAWRHPPARTVAASAREPGASEWAALARASVAAGRLPQASVAFRSALALRPDDAGLLADAADVVIAIGGPSAALDAEELLAHALQVDPRHVKSLALAGTLAARRHDAALARALWTRAIAAAPDGDPIAALLREELTRMPGS